MKNFGLAVAAALCFAALSPLDAHAQPVRSGIETKDQILRLNGGLIIGGSTTDKITFVGKNSATIDFTSRSEGIAFSSAITVTGAAVNDKCIVGAPAAASALNAQFGCYVTAVNEVKVWFRPSSIIATTCTLGGESPSVCPAQTVTASSQCNCSGVGTTAAIAAGGCAVSLSSTTLTITSLNAGSHVVNYVCRAPVDPASGSFDVLVFR